ncbi:MAG: hypothetical protein ACYDD0_10010, partial [Candidatus Dormibacteria bacterium]
MAALRARDRAVVGVALAVSLALAGCAGPSQRVTTGSAAPPSPKSTPTPARCTNQTVLAGWCTARL